MFCYVLYSSGSNIYKIKFLSSIGFVKPFSLKFLDQKSIIIFQLSTTCSSEKWEGKKENDSMPIYKHSVDLYTIVRTCDKMGISTCFFQITILSTPQYVSRSQSHGYRFSFKGCNVFGVTTHPIIIDL